MSAEPLARFDESTVVAVMTRDEAAESERRILGLTTDLRAELLRFYEGRGWAALGYGTWRAWAAGRLGQAERTAYAELTAGRVEMEILQDPAKIGSIPREQLLALGAFAPARGVIDGDRIRDAWEDAHATAEERGEKFTARHVTEAVQRLATPQELAPEPTPEPSQPAPAPMAVHFSSTTPEWYTPAHILELAREVMGGIDLDPASSATAQGAVRAAAWCGLDHPDEARRDGLAREWPGRVWLNPPYGDEIAQWVDRLVHQYEMSITTEAIALLPARTDTAWFQRATRGKPYPICFVLGRLRFSGAENSAPFPSALLYLGENVGAFHTVLGRIGIIR